MKTLMMKIKLAAAIVAGIVALGANAELTWTTGSYTPASWTPAANNVLKGLSATRTGDWYTESGKDIGNDVDLFTDGTVPGVSVDTKKIAALSSKNNVYPTLAWTFGSHASITTINIYSRWSDGGRDGISISKVEFKYAGSDDWVDLGAQPVDYGRNNNSSAGMLKAVLSQSDGAPLAHNATALRLTFGAQDNNGTGYVEIEAVGTPPPPVGPATAYNGSDITKEYTPLDQVDGLSWSGATRAYSIGDDVVLVFTDTTAGNCSFDVRPGYAGIGRFLVVAGGGPGGYNGEKGRAAGGGGAGGMLTGDDAVFSSGTYAITVGKGGKPTSSRTVKGANGSDSFISCGGAEFCRAKGGGAGGNVGNSESDLALSTGSDGGNGGGGSQCKSSDTVYKGALGGKGVSGQGFDGGRALDSDNKTSWQNSGAGGGAGGKGTDAESLYRGAKGGDGLPSDITGEKIWYAGGGAGGDWVWQEDKFFAGGKGGGGSVNNYGTGSGSTTVTAGTDTLGGGGAGGASAYNKNEWTGPARGGSGVVVVRLTVKKCDMIEGVTATGAAEMYGVGFGKEAETIIVFKDTTPGACSFTLPHNAFARVLLVGGGGPGGYNGKAGMVGAGGGAGGMVTNAYAGTAFGRGTYSVTVGAGGKPSTSRKAKGANGGDSVIARQSGSDVFRAKGGGAGGNPTDNNDNAIQYSVGSNGGSGGGGAQGYTTVNGKSEYYGQLGGSGVEGQGHNGGKALDCQKIGDSSKSDVHTVNAGGGGGAGANGPNAESLWRGAKGGDGLPCDITGAEVWYAGGGAGGVNTYSEDKEFAGGKGGGGATRSFTKDKNDQYVKAGTDGLGGGGGGGISSTSKNNWTGPGRGGDGVVIVRIVRMKKPGMAVILVENDEMREEEFETLQEAIIAAQTAIDKGCNATIKVLKDTDETVDGNALDPSQEIVFVSDDDAIVPVVQTSTEIMKEVAAGGKALTANTPKLRTFLTENDVEAYTALPATAAAISKALAEVPTGDDVNGLPLWKDYALGISPTDSVKAVADAAKDTDPNAITLAIPTIDPKNASGDFTISYQVTDRGTKELKTTAERADEIKIPLATGIYDVKIVFTPAT